MEYLEDENYTFLLCSERSGSNFITKLMNNHSSICGPSTKHIINPLVRNYFRYQPLTNKQNWNNLLQNVFSLFQVSFSIWNSGFTLEELLANIKKGSIRDVINYFFTKETFKNNKTHCFVKEIKAYEFYPFIKKEFPKANYLHLVRDPRDMALSWKKSKIHQGGIVAAAKQWKEDQQQYLKITELEKANFKSVTLKYENLVSDTENQLKKFLKNVNLDFQEEMIHLEKDKLTQKNAGQQKAWENLSKPVMKDNFNKFEKELTTQEIRFIEAICYFEMCHLDYKPKNNWEELKKIASKEINAFAAVEQTKLVYSPNSGVTANMEAKQRFYQYIAKENT